MDNSAFQDEENIKPQELVSMEIPSQRNKTEERRQETVGDTNTSQETVLIPDCASCCINLRILNYFRSPKWFLVFLSLAATVQGILVNGLVNVVITSIERRFNLQSTQTGTIASSYDIGSLIIMIPVSYFGGKLGTSKPRWIACGMFVMGLGSLLWTIPHFATEKYMAVGRGKDGDLTGELCRVEASSDLCLAETDNTGIHKLVNYRYVFILAQLLNGFGAAPLITLGTTFLDESVSKRSAPVYIAVFQTWFVIGPALGYILGGSLLSIHTDLVSDSGLSPSSSLWVGAWWPGFLLTFLLALVCAACIQCYPSSINRKKNTSLVDKDGNKGDIKPLPAAIWSLITNPTYVFVSLGGAIDGLVLSGLSAFLPKFIEQQYGLSNGTAALMVGLIVVPAGGGGTFLGGWIIKRLNLSRDGILTLCIVSQLASVPLVFSFFFSCPGPVYVGLHQPYLESHLPNTSYYPTPTQPSSSRFSSSCNTDCSCLESSYDPVCGSDNLMYVSPCFAGCSSILSDNFTECNCVQGGTAERTKCTSECSYLILFIIVEFVGIFLTFLANMPGIVACLRAVRVEEKSLALGLQSILLRVVGSIPGPILFGVFVDASCDLWEETCEGKGSCLLYDNYNMATSMFGICFLVKLTSVVFYSSALCLSKKSKIKDEKEENVKKRDVVPDSRLQPVTNGGFQRDFEIEKETGMEDRSLQSDRQETSR